MNRRYMLIILGILLAGITFFLIVQQQETPSQESNNQVTQQDQTKNTETSSNKTDTADDEDVSTEEATEESVSQLQELFQQAVSRTVNFFMSRDTHITAIGDSLTQGVGDNVVDGGYVGILDKTINESIQLVSFDQYGKRGNRSDQLLERLNKQEIEQSIEQSNIVLITIGANDIMQVVKENFTSLQIEDFTTAKRAYEDRLHQIFDKINVLNPNTDIYLIGIYNPFVNYFGDIEELEMIVNSWNETSRNVTEQYHDTTFIPVADLFEDTDKDLFADDNFHPNHQGYQQFTRRVLEFLTDQ
ncbi:Lysophospholipase L1 [Lentibacillus halodurans]|uniref:Lysophospholipase L1 n=1 Tax=Lentibacillus halodurans TaxID=237679 RepID=A0A1I0X9Y6_9BACI|nr:SGNH/GDSL hydrolase family protein [Lentibacillus halodurans]SFA97150.1 Lysophospholipase L1 [Lentibacillus halodurans]